MSHIRPRCFQLLCLVLLSLIPHAAAQTIDDLNQRWHDTFVALKNGQQDTADALFKNFNQDLRLYLQKNNADWRVEFLTGSLECQFSQWRSTGAGILRSVLQNNRDLNEKGKAQLSSWLTACTAENHASGSTLEAPTADIIDVAVHVQTPGIHSFGKAGYLDNSEHISGAAVSPLPVNELLARRVPISEPQRALDAALARYPGSVGSTIAGFTVATDKYRGADSASGIGRCLQSYLAPLKQEFEIDRSEYVVTVYAAPWIDQVYDNARKLHGLTLPQGVVAYSVLEDMSLSGLGSPTGCGSLAHELVHLLIKPKFPMSPAWLEEGLASEVAVSSARSDQFEFSWSWRDAMLEQNIALRPTVANLLETSWGDFNAAGREDLPRAAALQAMAAVFIRYLDTQGKLKEVYFAARDQHITADLSQYRSYGEILEKTFVKSVDDIDREFDAWFKKQQASRLKDTPAPRLCNGPVQGPCPDMKQTAN